MDVTVPNANLIDGELYVFDAVVLRPSAEDVAALSQQIEDKRVFKNVGTAIPDAEAIVSMDVPDMSGSIWNRQTQSSKD